MKLSVKKTAMIGVAFLTIMMLWQVYNWYAPIYLQTYLAGLGASELVIGIIMALDNLFALFMIPVMSHLSDKTHTRLGRRMPYVTVGIILSALSFLLLPFSMGTGLIALFIVNILLLLVCMNIYRSPCVALMPDITPKPFRSRANGIINIMGGIGAGIGLIIIFVSGESTYMPFVLVSSLMLIALVFLLLKVRENKLVAEYNKELDTLGIDKVEDKKDVEEQNTIDRANKRNLWLLLAVVLCVYMAINAVETFISLYLEQEFASIDAVILFGLELKINVLIIIPFGVATFIGALPAAYFASKFGRKYMVLLGTTFMAIGYFALSMTSGFTFEMLLFFFIIGLGFSCIVVNIYPMVVENSDAESMGKYTGYYYTASMLAQSITPAFVGLLMSAWIFDSMRVLFPYAFVFSVIATIIITFTEAQNEGHKK